MLQDNYQAVKKNIKAACEKAGRDPKEVTLIAVSKTKPFADIEEVMKTGCLDFGENKVQELVEKEEHVSKPVHWHLIGHLQTNKVKYIIDKAALIHSVDSVKLAECINKEGEKKSIVMPILIQVNIADEDTKFGLKKEETEEVIRTVSKFPFVKIKGLMTIAPFVEDPEENRIHFQNLRQLFIDIKEKTIDNVDMEILSMGMTGDYQVAVEEGATMVRVGTGIFGARNYNK
ncbi:MAG: YggS family pyridoxal phosphate-dependent enzyme [Lachnospiraceae bacterium]|nr:YggS family pyridoxal phosphate-dependent enzyme [Lachnospiraceae bacterium]